MPLPTDATSGGGRRPAQRRQVDPGQPHRRPPGAVVEERPGVTRDRKELDAEWCGRSFTIVDTGGWLPAGDPLDAQVSAQAERAIAEADVVLLVVDVTVGLVDEDLAVAKVAQAVRTPGAGGGQQGGLIAARGRCLGGGPSASAIPGR